MNIEYLRYFLDVARAKSITRAANMNFISPQGMSRAMRELEKELDCELLVRYSNRLSLSKQGEELVPYAKRVVDEYANFNAHALALGTEDEEETGEQIVRLLCQRICSFAFIPPEVFPKFFEEDARMQYREMENADIYQLFKSQASELDNMGDTVARIGVLALFDTSHPGAFTSIKLLEEKGYTYRPYLRTHDVAIVCNESPLAEKDLLTKDDIKGVPIIVSSTILHDCVAERFGEESIRLTTTEFTLREDLVRQGLGMSFLPAIAKPILDGRAGVKMVEFEDTYDVELGFLGRAQDLRSEPFLNFVKDLDEFYRAHQDPSLFDLVFEEE